MRAPLLLLSLSLSLVPAWPQSITTPASDHIKDAADEEGRSPTTTPSASLLQNAAEAGRCDASEDGDCKHNAANNSSTPTGTPSKANKRLGATWLKPGTVEYGLTARSLSISALDSTDNITAEYFDANNMQAIPVNQELKYRVFAQAWCSAASCPMALAATGSDMSVGLNSQDVSGGKGEAVLVAKGPTNFGAVAVSILQRSGPFGVCARAISTTMPEVSCAAVCWHSNATCACSHICNRTEVGSDSGVFAYQYKVDPDTSVKDLLSYLHLLMVRFHAIPDHINNAKLLNLNIPTRSLMIRDKIEKRFGSEKAKLIPIIQA